DSAERRSVPPSFSRKRILRLACAESAAMDMGNPRLLLCRRSGWRVRGDRRSRKLDRRGPRTGARCALARGDWRRDFARAARWRFGNAVALSEYAARLQDSEPDVSGLVDAGDVLDDERHGGFRKCGRTPRRAQKWLAAQTRIHQQRGGNARGAIRNGAGDLYGRFDRSYRDSR